MSRRPKALFLAGALVSFCYPWQWVKAWEEGRFVVFVPAVVLLLNGLDAFRMVAGQICGFADVRRDLEEVHGFRIAGVLEQFEVACASCPNVASRLPPKQCFVRYFI